MSKDLKPCPFCGGEAELYKQKHREYPATYYVYCKGYCIKQYPYQDKDRAIETWNRRKPIDRVVEQLEEMRDTECDAACDRRNNNYEQSNGFVKAIRCAIEIVKGGTDET